VTTPKTDLTELRRELIEDQMSEEEADELLSGLADNTSRGKYFKPDDEIPDYYRGDVCW
jgi:hypothetical protein